MLAPSSCRQARVHRTLAFDGSIPFNNKKITPLWKQKVPQMLCFISQPCWLRSETKGISHGLKTCHRHVFLTAFRFPQRILKQKIPMRKHRDFSFGDPYGNRTHVTAVKGRCLNRLTNGPGSGNLTRTDDIPGMNRLLYQLSYAAKDWSPDFTITKSASLLYPQIVKKSSVIFDFFKIFLAIL